MSEHTTQTAPKPPRNATEAELAQPVFPNHGAQTGTDRRKEFLRQFDQLIAYAEGQPFMGRKRALTALKQVRRQRGLG